MITVADIKRSIKDSRIILSGSVYSDYHRLNNFEVWFSYPVHYYDKISVSANPFVAALLMPAMSLGQTLRVEGKISKKMLLGVERFMKIMHKWRPEYKPVEIEADQDNEIIKNGRDIGIFFSGGLDSFYTLLKNENTKLPPSEKISHLIFVHGFDIDLDDYKLLTIALKGIKAAAKEYNKNSVQVSTNVKRLGHHLVDWAMYHGTALISVALCLEQILRKIYIPGSYKYEDLFPWGSHPLTDPLWSTESMDIIHDGCEASRVEKILWQVGKSQVALDNLRVCWENHFGRFNCGVCEKCIRTMLNLEAAGVLERCEVFKRRLSYSDVENLLIKNRPSRIFARENYKALVARSGDPQLIKALKQALVPWVPYQPTILIRKLMNIIRRN